VRSLGGPEFFLLDPNPEQKCHPDRSVAKWRDLQSRGPLLEKFPLERSDLSIKLLSLKNLGRPRGAPQIPRLRSG
jgi:hypothetical protein